MTETEFWAVVAELGWNKGADSQDLKLRLMLRGQAFCEAFREKYYSIRTALTHAAIKAGHDYCCDSWDDSVNHTIGLGLEEYQAALRNPVRMVERMNRGNYAESFAYCLPDQDDFAYTMTDHMEIRRDRLRQEYLVAEATTLHLSSECHAQIERVCALLAGAFASFEDRFEAAILAEGIARRARTSVFDYSSNPLINKWKIWNLIHDLQFGDQFHALRCSTPCAAPR